MTLGRLTELARLTEGDLQGKNIDSNKRVTYSMYSVAAENVKKQGYSRDKTFLNALAVEIIKNEP